VIQGLHVHTFLLTLLVALVWTTLDREPMMDTHTRVKASSFLKDYSKDKGIYMRINYFNPEHVHTGQEQHHAKKSFRDEFEFLVRKYGLEWHDN
jgi:hypothetical protein